MTIMICLNVLLMEIRTYSTSLIPGENCTFMLLLNCMQIHKVIMICAHMHLNASKINQSLLMAAQSSQYTILFSANLIL